MNLNNILQIDEERKKGLNGVEKNFKNFLKDTDFAYENRISFITLYNYDEKYYEIKINSVKEGFNSQAYFKFWFESEHGMNRLGEFCKENNVGIINY